MKREWEKFSTEFWIAQLTDERTSAQFHLHKSFHLNHFLWHFRRPVPWHRVSARFVQFLCCVGLMSKYLNKSDLIPIKDKAEHQTKRSAFHPTGEGKRAERRRRLVEQRNCTCLRLAEFALGWADAQPADSHKRVTMVGKFPRVVSLTDVRNESDLTSRVFHAGVQQLIKAIMTSFVSLQPCGLKPYKRPQSVVIGFHWTLLSFHWTLPLFTLTTDC